MDQHTTQTPNQSQYQPPQPVYPVQPPVEQNMSIGGWFGTFILESIPILNLIMYIVWACGGTTKPSLRKYGIARLIFWPVVILVIVLISLAVGGIDRLLFWS